jgi:hypothetical protein
MLESKSPRIKIFLLTMSALVLIACDLSTQALNPLSSAANKPTSASTDIAAPKPTVAPPSITATKPLGKLSDRVPAINVQVIPATATVPLTLSWNAISNATSYTVVVAEANPYRVIWFWVGSKTQVAYGDLGIEDDELTPDLVGLPITPTKLLTRAPALEVNKAYVWSVTAMNDKQMLAASVLQSLR